ncbi:MAG: flagellar hook-associated protein FlgK [Steroidobacterales bacterium]
MPDILRTGLSGLIAFQRALATTGHNVANVATDGYSRQVTDFAARPPQGFGSGFVGAGVDVQSVRRVFDQYSVQNLRTATSNLGLSDTVANLAGQIDDIIGDPTTGIASGLQGFFNAWQDVANDPSSSSARQVLVSQGKALANRFSDASSRLDNIATNVNARIRADVNQINSLATQLAKLNADIVSAQGQFSGQPPNDLLDKRDTLITQLAQFTNVSTTADADGAVNVFIGNGQPLVLRNLAQTLTAAPASTDPSKLDISIGSVFGATNITNALSGGELGGLNRVRDQLIDPARNQLGLIAIGLAQTVNAQQASGLDIQGQLGSAFFSVAGPQAFPRNGNAGTASVTASISGLAALTGDEYDLRYNGATYSLTRVSDGSSVTMTGAGTIANPFVAEGVSFVVAGAAAAGDQFRIQPTRAGASSIAAVLTDPRDIAAAGPIRTSAALANTGSASISQGDVLDATHANLLNTVNIQFLSATTYSVNGGPAIAYTSGANIDVNGWRVQITGAPATGDAFTVQANTGGVGDNRNALLAAGLQSRNVLAGGTASLGGAFSVLVGAVGTEAQQAGVTRDAQSAIASQAKEAVSAASGVNLDEEAADLVRWQHAYQAAAQTIAVASTIFDTLIAAVRR